VRGERLRATRGRSAYTRGSPPSVGPSRRSVSLLTVVSVVPAAILRLCKRTVSGTLSAASRLSAVFAGLKRPYNIQGGYFPFWFIRMGNQLATCHRYKRTQKRQPTAPRPLRLGGNNARRGRAGSISLNGLKLRTHFVCLFCVEFRLI
jgi:hypothetical protein